MAVCNGERLQKLISQTGIDADFSIFWGDRTAKVKLTEPMESSYWSSRSVVALTCLAFFAHLDGHRSFESYFPYFSFADLAIFAAFLCQKRRNPQCVELSGTCFSSISSRLLTALPGRLRGSNRIDMLRLCARKRRSVQAHTRRRQPRQLQAAGSPFWVNVEIYLGFSATTSRGQEHRILRALRHLLAWPRPVHPAIVDERVGNSGDHRGGWCRAAPS